MKRVDAVSAFSSRRAFIAEADFCEFFLSQFFAHHFRYVLQDVESAISATAIGARDNRAGYGMLQPVGSARWRTREGIAHTRAFLPTFYQNVFQRRARFQKFRDHESTAPRAVKLFATLSLQFPRAWWAPFISLCLFGFPGPNHMRVARLVHGVLL